SRVLFSAGWAARRLDLLQGADLVFAIPVTAASKNPFFDRKSPVNK
ncbi:MAG: ferredoxin, partial [Alistipes sp.]|nr:ferredoxin [Alistipes sp.]